jgi:hypothetical protein
MPQILTSSQYDELLSDDVRNLSDLDVRVEKAEYRVLNKYRQRHGVDAPLRFDSEVPGLVMLSGYATDDNGDPDTAAMDDELLRRLRLVIADVVEWRYDYEQIEDIDSEAVGERSATYSDVPELPSRLFSPLDKFDHSSPFFGYY